MPRVISKISDTFMVSEAIVRDVVKSAPYRYKVFKVPKRSGPDLRTIAQPSQEIKTLQRFVVSEFLKDLPIHSAATAYISGKGIKHNATAHASYRFLLKMDFTRFFPSIKPSDFKAHVARHIPERFDNDDLGALCSIIFWKPRNSDSLELCIGGPSSPFISNTVIFSFDQQVAAFCEERRVAYTRYADDMTFSTDQSNVLREIEVFVSELLGQLEYPKLTINVEKTVHSSKKHHRQVTGLVLSSEGKISLGRDRKRELRSMLHRVSTNHDEKPDIQMLKGYLAFAMDVEPEFVRSMRRKFGDSFIDGILRWSPD